MTDIGELPKRRPGRPRKNPESVQSPVDGAIDVPAAAPIVKAKPVRKAAADPAPAVPVPPAYVPHQVEAVTSPAIEDDSNPGPAATTVPIKESEPMATIAPPSSPAAAAEKAQAMFGDASARMKTAFEKSTKISEEMVEFTRGNVEALMTSARVAAKAGESLGQEAAEYGKKSFETASAAFKSFASVKSPTELFQLQSEYAKASFDSAVAEASKLSESLLKVMSDIAQPISTRYAVAAEKIKSTTL
ncbi:phasin family protein [Sphingomonas nostoxanthinifaciens]|uniref:phasin family protein n=1 Tax=Sphingomonas nostoxanthinifaciens TaxID=2872652 RepID=UPI001CC21B14|nr:phasin family protein [Sphingomonas nostoxanthinifaciens]UAK25435.1 phasin family protein [Sphingomonas nostoxanthinifaciens]